MDVDVLRFPIGPWNGATTFTPETRRAAIAQIEALPARMRQATDGLTDAQLDTPYRPGGWTVRQVVHHVADSHMNAIVRLKLVLTEDNLTIKPYDENAWSTLADQKLPIEPSLRILEGLHARWIALYGEMHDTHFARTFVHPEHRQTMTLEYQLHHYAWHAAHHLAHVTSLRTRQGW